MAQQATAGEDLNSSQSSHRLTRPSLNANGKRQAEVDPESQANGDNGKMTNAEEERKKREERQRAKAMETKEYEDFCAKFSKKVDQIYLGNDKGLSSSDGMRKPQDAIYMKMGVFWRWAEKRGGRGAFIKRLDPAPSSTQQPQAEQQKTTSEKSHVSGPHPSSATQRKGAKRQKIQHEEPQMVEPQSRVDPVSSFDSAQASMTNTVVLKANNAPEAQNSDTVHPPQMHATARSMPTSAPLQQSAYQADNTPTGNVMSSAVSHGSPVGLMNHWSPAPPSPPSAIQAQPSEFLGSAPKFLPFQKQVSLNGTPHASHMAVYEAMKVVQRQLHLQYIATDRSNLERIVVNGIDVARLLGGGVPHSKIVDRIAPYLEPQRQKEPAWERTKQGHFDENELLRRLAEFLKPRVAEYPAATEAERELYFGQR